MVKLLWTIIKDGLQAFAFWLVASLVMIYLWGYAGRMLSLGLGIIFVISFIAVTLKRIVSSLTGSRVGQGAGLPPLPDPKPADAGKSSSRPCPTCGGSGRTPCIRCNGSGWVYQNYENALCPGCSGSRGYQCTTCSGGGVVYW
jgi:hypothetical protein